jgi:D-tyrosyl-tRNA(Tyr) deacylase
MRAVVQRVTRARVLVDGQVAGEIGPGLCVLVGAMSGDTAEDVAFLARKLATLRIFQDRAGKMNLNVADAGGSVLLVSQFTLAADTTSGTRPSFSGALEPGPAAQLLEQLAVLLRERGLHVATGRFGARMELELTNSGPVTICLDSRAKKRK